MPSRLESERYAQSGELNDRSYTTSNAEAYLNRMREAPRLTSLLQAFGSLSSGTTGQPIRQVKPDYTLLGGDALAIEFLKVHRAYEGPFNAHFVASIPYILEEQCRFGAALWMYGSALSVKHLRPGLVYTLGDASGVTARSLTRISDGTIQTLTCSPNVENQNNFLLNVPAGAYFFLGPFFEVTPASLRRQGVLSFAGGFDVIVEDTTFQMYGPERMEPINLACRNLREDGIFVLIEKVRPPSVTDYVKREAQKDEQFKARYFDAGQIAAKRAAILACMQQQEASLEQIMAALRTRFSMAAITWNSGNFYTIAASNDASNLREFVGAMIEPAIPREFVYESLPRWLFRNHSEPLNFRHPVICTTAPIAA
jgi:hypothetical protein